MAGDLPKAAKLRDTITKIVVKEINRLAPAPRVGTVQKIDRENNQAWVRFPGDETELRVNITAGNQPRYAAYDAPDGTATGDVVRVGGRNGSFYLMDVLSSSAVNQHVETTLTTVQEQVAEVATDGLIPPNIPVVTFISGIGSLY